jgi:hypothetical protein
MSKLRTAGVITGQLFVTVVTTYLTWKLALWLGFDRERAGVIAVLVFFHHGGRGSTKDAQASGREVARATLRLSMTPPNACDAT